MPDLLLAVLLLASPAASSASETSPPAICRTLDDRGPPAADRPTAAQLRDLKTCNAEALYYGEEGAADYVKARLCAFREDDDGEGTSETSDVFAGQTILMQIYANGLGVRRDLNVATAYACNIDGAPAEVDSRVRRLQSLKVKPGGRRFDYCDDITSGLAGGFCAARDAEIAKKPRAVRAFDLTSRVPAAARPALATLRKASEGFVDAHGGEVDKSGTARAQMVIDEEEKTRDAFTGHLAQLVGGRWPDAFASQTKSADDALNLAYQRALAFLASKNNLTTVKPEDVRNAQRAWIVYRDAFAAFARTAGLRAPRGSVETLLTQERARDLTELAS